MEKPFTLGSLFDGSGGFPLAGCLCGISPVWASEVEPYPIAVTSSRFPNLNHLGDISKIDGATIPPVDVITFGSPCQDLSVAGKRAGLKHAEKGDETTTRSGLFMEAVRIIKEMRKATNGKYPTFALWENVPGAFSSNKGEDFRIVLEELIKIAEPDAVMPPVPKKGWPYADCYVGDGFSVAYRTLDAQYWGVPQRRRRIYLVADFRGERAGKILFERKGLRRHTQKSREKRQGTAADAEEGAGAADSETAGGLTPYLLKIRQGVERDVYGKKAGKGPLISENLSMTLGVSQDQYLFQPTTDIHSPILDDQGGQQITVRTDGKSPTLRAETHGNLPCVIESYGVTTKGNGDAFINPETHTALSAGGGQAGQGYPCVMQAAGFKPSQGSKARGMGWEEEKSPTLLAGQEPGVCITFEPGVASRLGGHVYENVSGTLRATPGDNQMSTAYSFDALSSNSMKSKNPHSGCREVQIAKTLDTTDPNPSKNQGGIAIVQAYSVENHPNDSRVKIDETGKVQSLTGRMGTGGGNVPMVLEEKPEIINLNKGDVQSKTVLDPDGIAPSLYAGECRGGGGEMYVLDKKDPIICLEGNGARPSHQGNGYSESDKMYTLNTIERHAVAMPIHDKATRHAGKRGDKHDGAGNGLGVGAEGDPMYTLTSGDHHAVAIGNGQLNQISMSPIANTLDCMHDKQAVLVEQPSKCNETVGALCARDYKGIGNQYVNEGKVIIEKMPNAVCCVASSAVNAEMTDGDISPCLMARAGTGGNQLPLVTIEANEVCCAQEPASFYPQMKAESQCFRQDGKANTLVIGTNPGYQNGTVIKMENQYIVRRLTPLECCRLQGFPDGWGEIDPKEDFTDEEYKFWYEVRNTHAAINGKKVQAYTKQQMLSWYNKLHTDSAEYKMWGNGIALPTALYVMEGIADALNEQEEE